MRAIMLMFDSLNRHMLSPYRDTFVDAPNFARLAGRAVTFDAFYAGSMPCMPARRELHTGRYNFLHRSWGPLEPFDDSMPQMLRDAGVHTHLVSDHPHYWEDGGATYHTRYTTWEFFRGQEGDPWKGVVGERGAALGLGGWRRQDAVNRSYMPTRAQHVQTRTVDAGIEFIDTNAAADDWFLQLELFDPHEPFFVHEQDRERYAVDPDVPFDDWPLYRKTVEPDAEVERTRQEYAALVSMCDESLGRVLDAMDEHGLWDDTMLIVNTDHGFLLGEHGWWGKGVLPWFNELVHLPMFMWDPRNAARDTRRGDLAQTIDIAPTLLRYFGLEPTADMQGHDLALEPGAPDPVGHDGALFGIHGGHVNVTDGRYVYMRAPVSASNAPLEEYTLMPTHMRTRFGVGELMDWVPAAPMPFTKSLRTMRMPGNARANVHKHGTLLFDLATDPGQAAPIVDDVVELRMAQLLVDRMRDSAAPASQYERLGLPAVGAAAVAHLAVRRDRKRAAAAFEPLPDTTRLRAPDLLVAPVEQLLGDPAAAAVVGRHVPWLVDVELVAGQSSTTLLDLARSADVSAAALLAVDAELAAARRDASDGGAAGVLLVEEQRA